MCLCHPPCPRHPETSCPVLWAWPWPATAAGLVHQTIDPIVQKTLRPCVDKTAGDACHRGALDDRDPIGQEENDPTASGTPRRNSGGTLPRRQRLAFVSREADRECGFPSTRHTAPPKHRLEKAVRNGYVVTAPRLMGESPR